MIVFAKPFSNTGSDKMSEDKKITMVCPMIPLRELVVLPGTNVVLDIGRDISKHAVERAQENDGYVVLVTQRQGATELPDLEDLYVVGTMARITKVEDNLTIKGYNVTVNVLSRVQLISVTDDIDCLMANCMMLLSDYSSDAAKKAVRSMEMELRNELHRFNRMTKKISAQQLTDINNQNDIGAKVDLIAAAVMQVTEDRERILSSALVDKRFEMLLTFLTKENEALQLEFEINQRVKKAIDKSQKEYYLREKIKAIHQELGEDEDRDSQLEELKEKIEASLMPEEVKERARKEWRRMRVSTPMSPEYGNIQNYLEFLVGLPWGIYKDTNSDLREARKILEEDHYGIEKVKERILEFLSVQMMKKGNSGTILCLVGPPGIGKTSLAQSIARALNRSYIRAALGGVQDVAEIRGHRRTYVGAIPGRIIQGISDVGNSNPVFLLDEIDKLTRDFKGDPSGALLEALDPEQNDTFSDHYLEVPFDLSKVFFITTANDLSSIPGPLQDRMEIIEMSSYTEYEKLQIAKKYLVKKGIQASGLQKENISFTEGALKEIIVHYTREAGVRELARKIESICRKHAKNLLLGEEEQNVRITKANVKDYLGKILIDHLVTEEEDQIGVATGLAWTPVGGEILQVECQSMPGKGGLTITGRLGDVMQESAKISLSFLRSVSEKLGIATDYVQTHDIHIHVPAGAVPKEGPSAGVTLTTALVSMMLQKPIRQDVAMTGEITLRGKVLAVGGIREKITAAHRAGSKIIIIPQDCQKELDEVPKEILDDLEIYFSKTIEDVWKYAFRDEVTL